MGKVVFEVEPVVTTEELRNGLVQLVDKRTREILPHDKSGNPILPEGKGIKGVEIIIDPPELKQTRV